ncbi:hypothetical protein BU26DRAFT_568995 [Trematosphaeria pertusa]|uniref:Uncharacterized protein n=1 Tax=Trematosphaeria pertusa TaxID=390896 RepID=A0A6A6I645_9PLEO|nr:uncharacterized protein BU26DRAFT_568995 [Trematosphaeria pertusa]KAF2245020.1 hypothetical protein BU26DRAFT_568995 [Trematosphaeria pertusa]
MSSLNQPWALPPAEPWLPRNATAEEVRGTAGHNMIQSSPRKKALVLAEKYVSWVHVPANEQMRVHDRVNEKLADEEIPKVGEDMLRWRMGYCIRDRVRFLRGSRHRAPARDREPATSGQSTVQPYDPIKDV